VLPRVAAAHADLAALPSGGDDRAGSIGVRDIESQR